jgi:methylphosphotriester-DNA--protein-cysteine methyltransferase
MPTTPRSRRWQLLDADGQAYESPRPGLLGGHRASRIYGRLDCPAALRAIARGGYVEHRVFFADEATAVAAGYRPCARCLPAEYAAWKRLHPLRSGERGAPAVQPHVRPVSAPGAAIEREKEQAGWSPGEQQRHLRGDDERAKVGARPSAGPER